MTENDVLKIKDAFCGEIVQKTQKNEEKQAVFQEKTEKILVFQLKIAETKDQLFGLRQYIDSNGIKYMRVL